MIRKIVIEEIENREEKIDEIIKAQLENKYNRLDRISQKVVEISKSLEFTQEQLDEELAKLKNDVGKIQTNIKDIENNLLDICEKKLQDNIRNKLGITAEIEFERCHRTGTFKGISLSQEQLLIDCSDLKTKNKFYKIQKSYKVQVL